MFATTPRRLRNLGQYDTPATEHIFELGFVKQIILAAIAGEFNGKKLKSGSIDVAFFKWILTKRIRGAPLQTGQKRAETLIIKRLMYTLGNRRLKEHFVIVDDAINSFKKNVSCKFVNTMYRRSG